MIYRDSAGGITTRSLKFWQQNRNRLGVIMRIEIQDRKASKWPLRLRGAKGHEVWLSGCVSGFPGEGSRATFEIISNLGFGISLEKVTTLSSFTLERKKHSFRRYGSQELLCNCGFVAPYYKLPEEQAELDKWCAEEDSPYCLGVHHADISGIIVDYDREIKAEEKKRHRKMSWFEQAEFALALSKNGVPQATKHRIEFKGSFDTGQSGWRCKCGYVYPPVPELAMGSNKVYEWLEPLKKKHEVEK